MNPVGIIVTIFALISVGFTIFVSIRTMRDQSKLTVKRRAEMLDSLKVSADTTLKLKQSQVAAEEYKFRLKEIAKRHCDSEDVPGYCAADDLEWPCPTADLANLRKNPKLVK